MGIRNIDKLIFEAPTRAEAIALYREWLEATANDVVNADTMIVRVTQAAFVEPPRRKTVKR